MNGTESVLVVHEHEATNPGWCALNSSHTYQPGEEVGLAQSAGRVLGWLCPACTAKYRQS